MTRAFIARRALSAALAGAALLASGGCDRPASARPVATRDSAGVRVIESRAPAHPDGAWTLSAAPVLSIGRADGPAEHLLDRVGGAVRLSDGRIVVANGGSGELRWYAPDGRHLATAGREGDGPGEFRSLRIIATGSADSVFVHDVIAGRITTFSGDARLAGTQALPTPPQGMPPRPLGRFADGTYLLEWLPPLLPDAGPGSSNDSAIYARALPAGPTAAELGKRPGRQEVFVREGAGVAGYPPPFARSPQWGVAPRGAYFTGGQDYSIEEISPDGRVQRIARLAIQPPAVAAADSRRYRKEWLAGDPSYRERRQAALDQMRFPATMPAYARLLVGLDGSVWAERFRAWPEQPVAWDVFGAGGEWLATVRVPAALNITQVGPDFVLGVEKNADGIEFVRMHRLIRQ